MMGRLCYETDEVKGDFVVGAIKQEVYCWLVT